MATPYIVLEYVEGETLKQLIRREGPLEIPQAIAYAIEIARALGAAHERLIVHRDVKPQNVLIGGEGGAKITDFGIARTLTEEGLTMDGRVLGTTDYVSPEQALGQPVTGQSDLYSLGVVLYEMLTGAVPFRGETPVAVAMRHVREQVPDVQRARPEVSAATAAVVERATAKDLAERYPDARQMVADLEEVLAIEAARAGQATGEVTSVLRTLPGRPGGGCRGACATPPAGSRSLALVGAIVAIARDRRRRPDAPGTGVAPDVARHRGCSRSSSARPRRTTTTRSAPAPKTATRSATSSTATPPRRGAPSSYYEGTARKAGGVGSASTSTPPRRARPGRSRSRPPPPASPCRSTRRLLRRNCPTATPRR